MSGNSWESPWHSAPTVPGISFYSGACGGGNNTLLGTASAGISGHRSISCRLAVQWRLKAFWWGFKLLQTHLVAVSQRTSDQRNGFTQPQREANLHSKNSKQIQHPNRAQTPHLFNTRHSPVHNPAASRCKINQNRWLNCQINQQRELWQYNKTTLNWQSKNKIKCCRY